ncbi:MAG: Arsenical resistance operon trans-acting repressor ArsD [Anaerosolibacter sp.]|jgi:hypothetical protein|uniref:arsenite efflux transporter metallochaperone ArsD n=1 Tax=Anaerosolibacter sp. TaxID=1872527 RepID=UPI00260CBCD6|nr:arsenite efflux transporter metallochaperone ArsD [Anaerosolibacter sp.]MDF2547822.1 Arsenical resistance operon trans-acting repressor ArsD [Anaerosolibacter sp.]
MKKMVIFEPAMCCPTGICGPSVDKELLRISSVINNLKKNGQSVERYNLTNNPLIFVQNEEINKMLDKEGIEILPVTMVDGVVVKTKAYPTNEELCNLLGVSSDYLLQTINIKTSDGCGCSGGCC